MAESSAQERSTSEFLVRCKRDAESLVGLLNSIDRRYLAEKVFDYQNARWGVRHNLPQWALNQARRTAYKRGYFRQVEYLDKYCGTA